MKKSLLGTLTALSLTAGVAAHAEAEHTLVFSSWVPPTHNINAQMLPKMIEMIEEATDGRVTGEVRLGIAPPPAQMDLVLDGAVDVAYVFHGYQPGRFTSYKLVELPGVDTTAEAASVAYWNLFQEHLAELNEHRGVKVIGLHTHGPGQLHTNTKIAGLADMAGLKLRMPGGVAGDVGAALGATGIQVPAPKVYETLASNTADGVMMTIDSRQGFRLTEVAPNYFEIPGGFFRGSFAYIMNEDAFADLPDDLQEALEEKVFGEPISRMSGAVWDAGDAFSIQLTKDTDGNTITQASAEDIASFASIIDDVTASVVKEVSAKGIDGDAALASFRSELGVE
ncbi:TRAP transporter substrate-binding protein [Sedimentitalea todarodis]|uniref:TRAP transporter substrate-binding protein n=1 Tax=Sedimentitalea todarodis TaxID=1631240 RepID=A0ABU3VHP8_9RHOB|nr:TRAP transporter substrate-binding protein [Sedimentitalea todarodis]MDU9005530.1 TRAP transporter substrate-binding protein [Sedimentitalea todarodis]